MFKNGLNESGESNEIHEILDIYNGAGIGGL